MTDKQFNISYWSTVLRIDDFLDLRSIEAVLDNGMLKIFLSLQVDGIWE